MTDKPDYTLQARVVAATWYLNLPADGILLDVQSLAGEIEKAMLSAHDQGYQLALAQCQAQPEIEAQS